jgi:hypothetical protein
MNHRITRVKLPIAGGIALLYLLLMHSVAIALEPEDNSDVASNVTKFDTIESYITPLSQLTSVNQLADVQPSDWSFQALKSLVERYGCIVGYPDGTYRGNQGITRYEFATGLNACVDRINELITSSTADRVTDEDLATLQHLQQNFATELATLRDRVDALETRTVELKANQFSTMTILTGQVIFAVNDGGFDGDRILAPDGTLLTEQDPNTTVLYRVVLDLNTSFTRTDLLKLRIDTGSNGASDNATGVLEPNFGSVLDYSVKPPSNGTFGISRLYYSFQPLENLTVAIGPNMRATDYIDRNSYANLSFRDFSTQALINNFILLPVNGAVAGASVDWRPAGGNFIIRAIYGAADAANSGDTRQPLQGVASFSRVLYPNSTTNPTSLGDRGLFGDTYQGAIELEYSPSRSFALRLQYAGGDVFDNRFDAFGVNVEWQVIPQVTLFGRYGFASYTNTVFGDVRPNYWMAGLAFPDLLITGAVGGIAMGQPFIEPAIGDATQANVEAFYNIPVNDNIRITPTFQLITHSSNQDSNGTILTGTIRTVFSF